MKHPFLLCLFFLTGLLPVQAQQNIKNPDEFLGYTLGTRFTPHHRVIEYFNYIAEASDKVQLQPYGTTYEQRPLLLAFISSPQNISRLENIRQDNLRRTGLLTAADEAVAAAEAEVSLVWLSYNVHGNEAVSTEAAMAVLYELVAPKNEAVTDWLQNVVVIIDPVVNPDGRERYVSWYNSVVGEQYNPVPAAREHHEPWPGGRANHYLFDLNRDWAWQTQRESRQRMKVYNQWLPHVHADFHEQGINEPYYFAPAAEPFHQYINEWQREFQTKIGLNNARYFDESGWLYFTREVFDLLYPSYGDTYPTFNGAIGMTYEQGGSGRAGLGVLTEEGDTLTLAERIQHHYTTSVSTIEATAKNHQQVVQNFERFFKNAAKTPPGRYQSYLIPAPTGEQQQALRDFLDLHQIRYAEANANRTYNGWSYADGRQSSFRTNAGDLVISARQPKGVLVQVLMDPSTQVSDSLTYDITAWGLPYVFGVEAFATTEAIPTRPVTEKAAYALQIEEPAPYAYVLPWQGLNDSRFLAALLKQEVKVRFSLEPFTTNNRQYGRGTLIITRAGNQQLGDSFDKVVQEAARSWERPLLAVTTGFVTEGKDFGSSSVRYIQAPQVAVLSGEGVSSLAFGEVWHFFDQQLGYPATVLNTQYWQQTDLHKFDVLVLPGGSYAGILDEQMHKNLMDWVRAGGKLIVMDDALAAFAGKEGISLERKKTPKEAAAEKEEEDKAERLRVFAQREREAIRDYNAGSIYKVKLDTTHPMAFGYTDEYFSLKTDADSFDYLKSGWNVGTISSEDALVSGFVGQEAQEKLENTLVFGVEEKGAGEIIYMVDNPLFRAFWHNGKLFFANALFMVGQ